MRTLLFLFAVAPLTLGDVRFVDDKKAAAATIEKHAASMCAAPDGT